MNLVIHFFKQYTRQKDIELSATGLHLGKKATKMSFTDNYQDLKPSGVGGVSTEKCQKFSHQCLNV